MIGYREKILNELDSIPDGKLKYLFEMIHSFKLAVLSEKPSELLGNKFAGTWIGDENAEDLIRMIKEDRVNRFKEIEL